MGDNRSNNWSFFLLVLHPSIDSFLAFFLSLFTHGDVDGYMRFAIVSHRVCVR